jgi:hypothetical protein
MNINRNNYEEYFVLYLDNELDSESRREVEGFAQQNPDLKAELDVLLQSKLTPDADISFSDKGSLMRFDSASISLANYEEWLTSYIDDELTEGERNDVEVFVAGNPAIQRELNLLQQTKLQPETIVFPYKESLYRKEEKARVIPVRWWRIAAAAVLLLGISTTTIVLVNNKKGNGRGDLVNNGPKVKDPSNNTTIKQPADKQTTKEQVVAAIDKKNDVTKELHNTIASKQKDTRPEKKKEQPVLKNEEPVIAKNEEKQPSNGLPIPEHKPNVIKTEDHQEAIADVNLSSKELTPSDKKIDNGIVTVAKVETSDLTEQPSGNKGLRGFLRKVTRTFEKRTNIKATDDDDRLLVAGLAIKL